MNDATDKAQELGQTHGTAAAEAWWATMRRYYSRPTLAETVRQSWPSRENAWHMPLPTPDLDGLGVVQALGLPIAEGDVDARYSLREAYRSAFTAAVRAVIAAKCEAQS